MRLATLFDPISGKAQAVFVLPGGERVDLTDVVHYAPQGATFDNFANLAEVASHLDVVLPAISGWRSVRPAQGSAVSARTKFLPPVPAPRAFRDFYAFEQHVKNCRAKRQRPAPNAIRTAISRCRAAPRASSRFATFAHAINSTRPTMPSRIRIGSLASR